MKYSKDEYILKNLSKIRHKQWELFIISRIIHLLNDSDIELVCQQPIRTREGTRYLDLCFPNLNVYLEIDELHHSKDANNISDLNRMREIIDVTDFSENRIRIYDSNNNDRDLNDITDEVDEFISSIKTTKERLLSKGEFIPWDYNNKYVPEVHIRRGYLDVKNNVSFLTHIDALRCFGYTGMSHQRANCNIEKPIRMSVWFPKFYRNDLWVNSLSDDEKTITMKENSAWAAKKMEDNTREKIMNNDYEHKKIVFGHFKDVLGQTIYKFLGEFHMNLTKSGSTQTIWERVKTRIDLSGIELTQPRNRIKNT